MLRIVRSGSIPACAGEPLFIAFWSYCKWVYPRVCGGTAGGIDHMTTLEGLSPRVRGNRSDVDTRSEADGSIPACAGEPQRLFETIW